MSALLEYLADEFTSVVVPALRPRDVGEPVTRNESFRARSVALNYLAIGVGRLLHRTRTLQQSTEAQAQVVIVGVLCDETPEHLFTLRARALSRNEIDKSQLHLVVFWQHLHGVLEHALCLVQSATARVVDGELIAIARLLRGKFDQRAQLLFRLLGLAGAHIELRQDFTQFRGSGQLAHRATDQRDGCGEVADLLVKAGAYLDRFFVRRRKLQRPVCVSNGTLEVALL